MEWLNYHHLLYFYTVAQEGSVSRAAEKLFLTQPTLSSQIRSLEMSLGEKLFQRAGRGLKLTEAGQMTFRYAEDIFSLGKELRDTLKGRPSSRAPELRVGLSDVVSKLVARQLLLPVIEKFPELKLICNEDKSEALFLQLAGHQHDVLITDSPLPPGALVKAFTHPLGESGICVLGAPSHAAGLKRGFPKSLEGQNVLMPTVGTALRRSIDSWLERKGVRPRVVGEFADSSLIKVFASKGVGLCFAPAWVEGEIKKQFGLVTVGLTDEVREPFYVISPERRIKHPAVMLLCEQGRKSLG